jgi:hypothetical protein
MKTTVATVIGSLMLTSSAFAKMETFLLDGYQHKFDIPPGFSKSQKTKSKVSFQKNGIYTIEFDLIKDAGIKDITPKEALDSVINSTKEFENSKNHKFKHGYGYSSDGDVGYYTTFEDTAADAFADDFLFADLYEPSCIGTCIVHISIKAQPGMGGIFSFSEAKGLVQKYEKALKDYEFDGRFLEGVKSRTQCGRFRCP